MSLPIIEARVSAKSIVLLSLNFLNEEGKPSWWGGKKLADGSNGVLGDGGALTF